MPRGQWYYVYNSFERNNVILRQNFHSCQMYTEPSAQTQGELQRNFQYVLSRNAC